MKKTFFTQVNGERNIFCVDLFAFDDGQLIFFPLPDRKFNVFTDPVFRKESKQLKCGFPRKFKQLFVRKFPEKFHHWNFHIIQELYLDGHEFIQPVLKQVLRK